jgi:hypothetical protein
MRDASSGHAASSREGIVALQSQIRFRRCLCRSRTLTFSIPTIVSLVHITADQEVEVPRRVS